MEFVMGNISQLILHLFGDFIIQNDWMALNKKKKGFKGFSACFIHCLLYALPFLLIAGYVQVFFIFITHYVIDRYNVVTWFLSKRNGVDMSNYGFSSNRPEYISVWLNIITDNTFHLMCNYLILSI
jgi:hypothetical protein